MHVTFVKKILANGELCQKCRDVSARLDTDGLSGVIDHIAIADQSDPESEGARIAEKHKVSRAPFFVVKHNNEEKVFEIYFKFKEYLSANG